MLPPSWRHPIPVLAPSLDDADERFQERIFGAGEVCECFTRTFSKPKNQLWIRCQEELLHHGPSLARQAISISGVLPLLSKEPFDILKPVLFSAPTSMPKKNLAPSAAHAGSSCCWRENPRFLRSTHNLYIKDTAIGILSQALN
jgi:hypothetical protein